MDRYNAKKLAAEGKVFIAAGIGEESIMPNPDKAAGQHMHKKAANKFQRIESHHFLFVAVLVIPPAE